MQIILLSGGSGQRLWPLSNTARAKQFLKIFPAENGGRESMLQRVYRQTVKAMPHAHVIAATAKEQVSALKNQLGDIALSVEPLRRDTFPAIALTGAYLRDKRGARDDEDVLILPIDSYVDGEFFLRAATMPDILRQETRNLVLMGIKPTYPSAKYGYILEKNGKFLFKEKPDEKTAREYIDGGALWNAGVFALKLGYIAQKAKECFGAAKYEELLAKYETLPKISFDYAVTEHEDNIGVARYEGEWKDIGTWNTLTEAMEESIIGEAYAKDCQNVHIINELNAPIICMGLKNTVVAAGAEGLLVAEKKISSYMKPLVEKIESGAHFAEKSWGTYRVIDEGKGSLTIKVTLMPGHSMKYHSHEYRDEVWTVIEGEGEVTTDEKERRVNAGDVVHLPRGCRHKVRALTLLRLIEVQTGQDILKDDKILW